MNTHEYINVAGQTYSGSLAVNNYLNDFEECYSMSTEIDICLREFGIFGMYQMLEQGMPMYGVIDRFATYIDYVAPRINYMKNACSSSLEEELTRITRDFLNRISWNNVRKMYTYDFCFIDKISRGCIAFETLPNNSIKERLISLLWNRIRKYVKRNQKIECALLNQPKVSYRCNVNAEQYRTEAKRYLNEYASLFTKKRKFVVNNFFEFESMRGKNYEKLSSFFDGLKVVFVTRDPRDQFVSQSRRGMVADERVEDFIRLSKERSWIDFPHIHSNMLDIRFEDFVLHHEETSQKILDFIGMSKDSKVANPAYNVEDSKKNVGRWKSYPNQKVMDKIASELKDYLYEA